MSKATLIAPALAAILLLLATHLVPGQSSLFDVATTDVVGKGHTYIEADFDTHVSGNRDDRWQSYGFFTLYGTSKKTEIGANAYFVRTVRGSEPIELQPNFKYQIYNNESKGIAAAAGVVAYVPLTKRFGHDAIASVYAVASKKFKGDWSPRLTGGGYELIGAKKSAGDRRGFLFGVEQPVTKRLSLISDWVTGKNRLGYVATGLGITLTKHSYLWTAYYFGNSGRANNSLGIYYGYSF
jgi:hypothetical protein